MPDMDSAAATTITKSRRGDDGSWRQRRIKKADEKGGNNEVQVPSNFPPLFLEGGGPSTISDLGVNLLESAMTTTQ